MDIFSVDFTQVELGFIRQSLDLVTISGKDAKFLASLQLRIENELVQIEQLKKEEEQRKMEELQKIVSQEDKKSKKNT
jgi:hypothetical protein